MEKSSLDNLASDLESSQKETKAIVGRMNDAFLKSSQFLESIVESSSALETESRQIIEMVTWSDGSESDFNSLIREVNSSVAVCSQFLNQLRDQSSVVVGNSKTINEFITLESQLMNTLHPLKTMRTFFLVEISKIHSDRQEAMRNVVSDIETLYGQAEKVTSKEMLQMKDLRDRLTSDRTAIEELIKELERSIREEKERMDSSISGMQKDLRENRHVDNELGRITREIAKQVSRTVTAIQSDDITSQKIDHIAEAIEAMVSKIEEWSKDSYSIENQNIAKYLVSSARIQKKQIQSVMKDFKDSSEEINHICPVISEMVRELDKKCLSLKEYNTLTTSADGAIQVLLEALDAVDHLFQTTNHALRKIHSLLKPLEQISSESAEAIDDITIDLRVVTVNARIMASKVGAQSGLTPLTENVGQISLESNRYSNQLRTDLHSFVVEVSETLQEIGQTTEKLEEAKEAFQSVQNHGKQKLHNFRDKALMHLHRLSEHAEVVEREAERCIRGDEAMEFYQYFESLQYRIQYMEDRIIEHVGDSLNLEEIDAEIVSDLHENYTMHSERKNHEMAIDSKDDSSSQSTGAEDEFILF